MRLKSCSAYKVYHRSEFLLSLRRLSEFKVIKALTVKSDVWTNFVQSFDFTVKALMISNSSYHHYFQMKTGMNVKIGSYTKLCMQNKILASKMQNLKQQKTSVFAPLILKRLIGGGGEQSFQSQYRLAIKNQLCNPCNKSLCFVKLKQVLNCKVHNLGKTASRFLFWQVLICGDLL